MYDGSLIFQLMILWLIVTMAKCRIHALQHNAAVFFFRSSRVGDIFSSINMNHGRAFLLATLLPLLYKYALYLHAFCSRTLCRANMRQINASTHFKMYISNLVAYWQLIHISRETDTLREKKHVACAAEHSMMIDSENSIWRHCFSISARDIHRMTHQNFIYLKDFAHNYWNLFFFALSCFRNQKKTQTDRQINGRVRILI